MHFEQTCQLYCKIKYIYTFLQNSQKSCSHRKMLIIFPCLFHWHLLTVTCLSVTVGHVQNNTVFWFGQWKLILTAESKSHWSITTDKSLSLKQHRNGSAPSLSLFSHMLFSSFSSCSYNVRPAVTTSQHRGVGTNQRRAELTALECVWKTTVKADVHDVCDLKLSMENGSILQGRDVWFLLRGDTTVEWQKKEKKRKDEGK